MPRRDFLASTKPFRSGARVSSPARPWSRGRGRRGSRAPSRHGHRLPPRSGLDKSANPVLCTSKSATRRALFSLDASRRPAGGKFPRVHHRVDGGLSAAPRAPALIWPHCMSESPSTGSSTQANFPRRPSKGWPRSRGPIAGAGRSVGSRTARFPCVCTPGNGSRMSVEQETIERQQGAHGASGACCNWRLRATWPPAWPRPWRRASSPLPWLPADAQEAPGWWGTGSWASRSALGPSASCGTPATSRRGRKPQ